MSTEAAWAAGLFEGEGYVSSSGALRCTINMTDPEPLLRFHEAVGVGTVRGPYAQRNPNWRPYYTWRCSGWDATMRLYELFEPYLSQRLRRRFVDPLVRHLSH
jgi:hypothetical protein